MKCEHGDCRQPATATHVWGLYPHGDRRQAALCDKHAQELWEMLKAAVSGGLMH